jgi:cystathionine beta-lyase/cystathionine gamma-synthase
VLSFELEGGERRAEDFAHRVVLPAVAPSLGGVQTLLTRPATTSHAGLAREERLRLGIRDGLLRLSVGIEATDDLLEDFRQALA